MKKIKETLIKVGVGLAIAIGMFYFILLLTR